MVKIEGTIQTIAKVMLDNLEHKTRTDGSDYVCNKVSVDWQKDIIHKAHEDKLPNDYTYQFIEDALLVLADSDPGEEEDAIYEIEPAVYTSELTRWLNSRCDRVYYIEEAVKEHGQTDGFQILMTAYGIEQQEVARLVLQGIREYIKE